MTTPKPRVQPLRFTVTDRFAVLDQIPPGTVLQFSVSDGLQQMYAGLRITVTDGLLIAGLTTIVPPGVANVGQAWPYGSDEMQGVG